MKDRSIRFLQEHVIGKILETDKTIYKLEDGNLEGVYQDKMIFSDLSVTTNGFRFHMTTVTEEKLYQLDTNGNRGTIRKDFTGTSVFCYELAFRKSTSQLTGFMRCLSSTVNDHTMEAVVYGIFDVQLNNNELSWKESQLLYRDMPTGEGQYRPVAFDADIRFYLIDNKIIFEYKPTSYWDVDPDTMKKVLSKGNYPPFISREK